MIRIKAYLKRLFYLTRFSALLDKLVYSKEKIRYYRKNQSYKRKHPNSHLPPDYYLYETFRLDYELYLSDGDLFAKEIIEWANKYLQEGKEIILEWGCGPGRIIRHVSKYTYAESELFACDINEQMINWDKQHIQGVEFSAISYVPPTDYREDTFTLIYGMSVFTHIDSLNQEKWIEEIYRILKKGGVFMFTTHGEKYFGQLLPRERKIVSSTGAFTRNYEAKGHRLMTTYNEPAPFKKLIEKYFEVMEYYDGGSNMNKAGGQDLWIVRKNNVQPFSS